jgi:DNA-directed RNA polymerase subunit RPC12/RpoP
MVLKEEQMNVLQILWEMNKEKKAGISCPYCNSHNWEFVSTPRKPGNWISVFFSFITGVFAATPASTVVMAVEKVYHCFDCGAEFDNPLEKSSEEPE